MSSSVSSREARRAKAMAFLARPTRILEEATDINGETVRVGDSLEFAPGRTTVVTSIYQDPTSEAAYELPVAEVANQMIGQLTISFVRKVNS